jgi:hypothetical protein
MSELALASSSSSETKEKDGIGGLAGGGLGASSSSGPSNKNEGTAGAALVSFAESGLSASDKPANWSAASDALGWAVESADAAGRGGRGRGRFPVDDDDGGAVEAGGGAKCTAGMVVLRAPLSRRKDTVCAACAGEGEAVD